MSYVRKIVENEAGGKQLSRQFSVSELILSLRFFREILLNRINRHIRSMTIKRIHRRQPVIRFQKERKQNTSVKKVAIYPSIHSFVRSSIIVVWIAFPSKQNELMLILMQSHQRQS